MFRLARAGSVVPALVFLCVSHAPAAHATETRYTLTLDALSFISFGDREVLPIPAGSTIGLRFGEPAADGSRPFTIAGRDVKIAPIALASSAGELRYALAGSGSGTLRSVGDALSLELTATIEATLVGSDGDGTRSYTLRFTTETVEATDRSGTESVAVAGVRADPQALYVQLVTATTNSDGARPQPGTAVYAVLSGRFDRLPGVAGS